jgi:carbon-monoxide dehydrogenase large subunit
MTAGDARDFAIGASPPRVEDDRLIRGNGRFTDDLKVPGECHMVVVRSTHGHARIAGFDLEAARGAPGVLAVATMSDLKADGLKPFPVLVRHPGPNGEPMFVPERHALADGVARYTGDPVLAVIASTRAEALAAAELCGVDYEPLPAVTDIAEALALDAPTVWKAGNLAFEVERGDRHGVDAALASAAHVVHRRLRISRVTAVALEPRGALAEWSAADGRYTLTCGTHTPHQGRQALAVCLGVALDRIRVVSPDLGGSFGMRDAAFPEYLLALWAARRLGRPVRWLADRSESMAADHHARDNVADVELALDMDGIFTGLRVTTLAGMGAYLSSSGTFVPIAHVGGLSGVYRTPAIHTVVRGVYANTSPVAAYRGAGRPEAIYAIERIVEIAAAELGIDRIELRRRNIIPADRMPWKTGFLYTYDSGDFAGNMEKALADSDWSGFAERRREATERGRLRGIGVANSVEPSGGGPLDKPFAEGAELRLSADGGVTVVVGSKSHGQGHETLYAQLVADRLGIAPDRIRFVSGDTDALPFGLGSFASRTTAAGGTALFKAADRVLDKAKRLAAHLVEASPDDMAFEAGAFRVVGTDRIVSLAAVCALAHDHFRLPPGEDLGLQASAVVHASAQTFPTGCHVCEVEVDPETGGIELLRYLVVDDVGRVIHPKLVAAQLHGGAAQGIGQAWLEEVRYDAGGQLVSGSLQDYALPRADDLPMFQTLSSPTPTLANPLGAKGVGEAGTVGALPAFVNAVADALSARGVTEVDMPLTPLRIWEALQRL